MMAEGVMITGHGGDEIEAYCARPTSTGLFPGVVVIHHMPGYDRSTKEIVRTFAAYGYAALCRNLHYRYAPGAKAADAAAAEAKPQAIATADVSVSHQPSHRVTPRFGTSRRGSRRATHAFACVKT